uniref:Uncharacterized protein n=1 Tax=Rhizophora mucronata TaxID=61149 RepID=A0A2P2QAY3_RHIMU
MFIMLSGKLCGSCLKLENKMPFGRGYNRKCKM